MAAVTCDIIGTGDGKAETMAKCEGFSSSNIAKEIVLEIVNNAMEKSRSASSIEAVSSNMTVDALKSKSKSNRRESKEKTMVPLIGTGDQKSSGTLVKPESVRFHPPVEKKNRLTDLVKNSKQILARIMMTDSKSNLQPDLIPTLTKEEETVIDVIELDCVQLHDIPFKCYRSIPPEEVPLPRNDSDDILSPATEEVSLQVDEFSGESTEKPIGATKKMMTFPRVSGSKARSAFASKYRTLKGGISLKKKKWNVGDRIAKFFRKKKNTDLSKECETTKESSEKNGLH
ncbi:uncharacterized protein LOC143195046 [Rhynchophorus ferrugineus]|uniref:uncharacterized protein LOC143195046 n=1 Tax=Rhynchophorus ferrugineus TaxID=354439 RepID=UPI003FCE5341